MSSEKNWNGFYYCPLLNFIQYNVDGGQESTTIVRHATEFFESEAISEGKKYCLRIAFLP